MDKKSLLRRKFFFRRKKSYFNIKLNFFSPLKKLIKRKKIGKNSNISLYYPNSYEVNIFRILEIDYFKKFNFLLPIIGKNNSMNFYEWKKKDILRINKFGIPEPTKTLVKIPDIILLPLLAFDKNRNRLGYGKGFYDRYLNKFIKIHKKILTVGVAFSFQKYHKLPVNKNDFKLDFIITEKGIF